MYTNLYVYTPSSIGMSGKLYHRIKKANGKWSWKAACKNYIHVCGHVVDCECENDGI